MDTKNIFWLAAAIVALAYLLARAWLYPDGEKMGRSLMDEALEKVETGAIQSQRQAKKHLSKLIGSKRKDD